jgi:hypothetical protein
VPVPQETSPPARAEDPPVAESLANQPSVRSEKAPGAASATPNKKAGGAPKDPLTDPLARVALSLVGADLDAEIYWAAAINDPGHPPGERQDLIEDLNEEGFSDPKHPTPDDLPLIMSRIALIEEFWPSAMDKTNWEAFDEAYKDLWNLYDLALGDGQPVK